MGDSTRLPSRETCRRYTTLTLALVLLLATLLLLGVNIGHNRDLLGTVLLALALLGASVGLYRQVRICMRLTAAFFVMVAVFLPLGVFNPFTAGDRLLAGSAPSAFSPALYWLVPLEVLLLALAFVVNPPAKQQTGA